MFLSIFAATCRPNNIVGFLDNLAETANDPGSFEVLIKLDEGADELIQLIENYQKTASFSIKYLALPKLDGYYSLDVGYNELLKIAHKDAYFCWLLTDEIRLKTKGWDAILKKYISFYPDDVFRIKLSIFQSKNYIDFAECLPCPDNYAVTTRKWLEITGGWGHFWGPDSWHQCIDYYLGLCKNPAYPFGTWRSFPIFDINVSGQEAGLLIPDRRSLMERKKNIWLGWRKHSTHQAQENYFKLAQRLALHTYAHYLNLKTYVLCENLINKTVLLYSEDHKKIYYCLKYKLPTFKLNYLIGYKTFNPLQLVPFLFVLKCHVAFHVRGILNRINEAQQVPEKQNIALKLAYLSLTAMQGLNKIYRVNKKKLRKKLRKLRRAVLQPFKSKEKIVSVSYKYDGKQLNFMQYNKISEEDEATPTPQPVEPNS